MVAKFATNLSGATWSQNLKSMRSSQFMGRLLFTFINSYSLVFASDDTLKIDPLVCEACEKYWIFGYFDTKENIGYLILIQNIGYKILDIPF